MKTALLICDIQKKTIKNLYDKDKVISNINKFLYLKDYLPLILKTIKSEFIPEKLGKTDSSLKLKDIDYFYEKNSYSMLNDELYFYLRKNNISNLILTGMEIQWCINNSTKDFVKNGFITYIPTDCVGNSLSMEDNKYNFEHLKNNGAKLTTSDSLICNMLDNSNELASKKYLELLKKNKKI